MICTLQSENRQLLAEVEQLNERVENLLRVLKNQSIEMGHLYDLIHYAQHLLTQCPYCERLWRDEIKK